MLAYIWAESRNHIIGKNGKLPWHIADDMKFFKETTINHQILAGYNTYLSFGRPLPKRKNLVLTHRRQTEFPENVKTFNTIDDFLHYANANKKETIFVVGGTSVFKLLEPYVKLLYRTYIDKNIDGDTKMIPINYDKFNKVKSIPGKKSVEYPHHFEVYKRK